MNDIDGGDNPQPAGSDNAQSLTDVQTVDTPSTIRAAAADIEQHEDDSLTMSITPPAKSDSPDTAAKSGIEEATSRVSANFRRLVLFCIEADFCVQIFSFQRFSRSTGFAILCTAPN